MRLAEASYDMTELALQDSRQDKNDERLLVKFGMHPHLNTEKSAKEGRPIYDEKLYVMIMVPGDKESIIHRPAWDQDFARFPKQYAAYKNKESQEAVSGTPLRLCTFLTQGQVKELEHFNCYTVEQLAELADAHASKFMGLQRLKQLARDFLISAKEQAPLTTIRAEIEKKDSELEAARTAMAEQAARIKALEDTVAKLALKATEED